MVEDYFYSKENSVVYVGENSVTVIGATWTPQTAKLLAIEIGKVSHKANRGGDRYELSPRPRRRECYFKGVGAKIVSTKMTRDLLEAHWDEMIRYTQKAIPSYPTLSLVLPDRTFAGDFELQGGHARAIYLGPSHTPDGIFVYFPEEKSSTAIAF